MLVSRPARTTEIWPGQARLVKGEQIALFNVDSQFFALDNTCNSPRRASR
jgi:nitrite reductase/ring-hydroxylating ferredoxin subunit